MCHSWHRPVIQERVIPNEYHQSKNVSFLAQTSNPRMCHSLHRPGIQERVFPSEKHHSMNVSFLAQTRNPRGCHSRHRPGIQGLFQYPEIPHTREGHREDLRTHTKACQDQIIEEVLDNTQTTVCGVHRPRDIVISRQLPTTQ